MNDAAQRGGFFDERANTEGTQDALRGHAFFRDRRVGGNGLTIESLYEVISRQGDLEQVDKCLDALGRFEEQRSNRQRRLPLMMGLFDVALLLELGEECVG